MLILPGYTQRSLRNDKKRRNKRQKKCASNATAARQYRVWGYSSLQQFISDSAVSVSSYKVMRDHREISSTPMLSRDSMPRKVKYSVVVGSGLMPSLSSIALLARLPDCDGRRSRAVGSSHRELVSPNVALVCGVALHPLNLRLGAHSVAFPLLHEDCLNEISILYWALVCPPTICLPFNVPFLDTLDRVL